MRGSAFYDRKYLATTNSVYAYLLTLCFFCWIAGYVKSLGYPLYGEVTASPLWNWICQILPDVTTTYLVGIVLMFGGAFFVHRANYVMVLIREKTLLPFLYYAFFTSTNPDFFPFRSTSIAVFCLILALYFLFGSYHDENASSRVFNSTLMIGLGSLLWIHILWFLPLFWIGMYNFRCLSPRTFLASLLGVSAVYWIVLGWSVWRADYSMFTVPFSNLVAIHPLRLIGVRWVDWLSIAVVIALTVISSVNIMTHENEDSLRSRQFLAFLMVMAIWAFALFFFYEQSSEEFLEMACVPASILVAHFFTVVRGKYVLALFHASTALLFALLILRIWNFL